MNDLSPKLLKNAISTILSSYTGVQKSLNKCKLDDDFVIHLVNRVSSICLRESSLLFLKGTFLIVGDIHGSFESLVRIFNKFDYPPKTSYIFLGDYVDRGKNSCEVLILLYILKVLFPNNIYLIRGNHETESMTANNGFKKECLSKYTESVYKSFIKSFNFLSIAAVLNKKVFCVHGGISPHIKSLHDLISIKKPINEPFNEMLSDIFWSDPCDSIENYGESYRTIGKLFGYKAATEFLDKLGLMLIIRSHEMCEYGYEYPFDDRGKVLTVFSSIGYCGNENSGAVVTMNGSCIKIDELLSFTKEQKSKFIPIIPPFALTSASSQISLESLTDNIADVTIPPLVE